MSYINRIAPPRGDYLARLVAKTRRDGAALLARFGPYPADDEDSAALLLALAEAWPADTFDELNIGIEAPYQPRLARALGFLGPLRAHHSGGGLRLSRNNERDVLRWMLGVAGREVGGLRLERNAIGWCRVKRVAGQ